MSPVRRGKQTDKHRCTRGLRRAGAAVLVLLVASCATFRSYQSELNRTLDLVEVGDVAFASSSDQSDRRRLVS